MFDKDKTIELASEHLPFALSLTGSNYLNNDMLTIRTHCLKEVPTKCIFLATKEKEIDNIRRTPFELALIKSRITIAFYNAVVLHFEFASALRGFHVYKKKTCE